MKLYYVPGACSLSAHIALHESGLPFEVVAVTLKTHTLPDGTDYYAINPLGYVPYLTLETGECLHEGPAIVQYIADQVVGKGLAPANGTYERYKLQEWLTLIGTEVHKTFSPLFVPTTPAESRAAALEKLQSRLKWVDAELAGKQYLMNDTFTVADGYLFTVTNWAPRVGLDLTPFPNLMAYRARVGARPAVVAAMRAEGLIN